MEEAGSDNVLILVRAAPRSPAARDARQATRKFAATGQHAITVFFHGEAVAAAALDQATDWGGDDPASPVRLLVCQSAWKRRFHKAMAQGFEVSSLVRFWQLAIEAEQIRCFGGRHDN